MAIIQTIRTKYGKLAGAVIALSLVGFIVEEGFRSDYVKNIWGQITGNPANAVAKVDGYIIDVKAYEQRIHDYENLYEVFNQGKQGDDNTRMQLRQQALQELLLEKVIADDAKALGLTITEQEVKDMTVGANPDQAVQQFPYFQNQQTHQFDPAGIRQFEAEVKRSGSTDPMVAKAGEQWEALKAYVIRQRLMQKYQSLVSAGVYTPRFVSQRMDREAGMRAGIRYVKVSASSINDNDVKVTDADIKDYINKHQAQFQVREASRSIDYVVFEVKPDTEDTARALGELQKIRNDFAAAADVETFVNGKSDDRFTNTYVTRKNFMNPFADSILSTPTGSVFGPYFDNGSYKMTRIVETKSMPDSVRAQHILIARDATTDDSAAHKRADSLLVAIRGGANFDSLAAHYSTDQGSKVKGGDLGYYTYGTMVQEFNDFTFAGKAGDMKVVKTQFGYHVIRITDQKNFQTAYKVATIVKSLNIGDQAEQTSYAKANEFAGQNNNGKAFDAAIKKGNIEKRTAANIRPIDFTVTGLNSARELVRWIYDAKVGDVSTPMKIGDDRYIVAKVSGEQKKGLMELTDANRQQLEALVRNEKKLDMIAAKYKSSANLDAVAAASGQPVQSADSLNAAQGFAPSFGAEPKVVGYTFFSKFQPNAMSPAIKGRDAVYFITLVHREQDPMPANPQMMAQQRNMMDMQIMNTVRGQMLEQMRVNGDITYYPRNIF